MNRIAVNPGHRVIYNNRAHVVVSLLADLDRVLARDELTGASVCLKTNECRPIVEPNGEQLCFDLVDEPKWLRAYRDYELLGALREAPHANKDLVKECMERSGWSRSTVFRRREQFLAGGTVSSLYPRTSWRRRSTRLEGAVESIVAATIEDVFLNPQQYPAQRVCEEVRRKCRAAQLRPPSDATIRRRIDLHADQRTQMKRRSHKRVARDRYELRPGSYDEAAFPLSVVQIDHALCDIQVVDELTRETVGRPWLTVGLDVHSRCVHGFFLSMHEPGFGATGLCIRNGSLPKDELLRKYNIEGQWPVRGIPHMIHVDNAKDFRGKSMERAAQEWGVHVQFRPVKRPAYGGHVERFFGTLQTAIHGLPGSTFSNPKQRGDYKSEAAAALSLQEFEAWLLGWIVNRYHGREHRGIQNMTPLERYTLGLLGTPEAPGPGLPDEIADVEKFSIDWSPSVTRTIQKQGVQIENIFYAADILSVLRDQEKPNESREHVFHFDPRDTSCIYFYDEQSQHYERIPRANTAYDVASLWEVKAARKRLKALGLVKPDEDDIFREIEREKRLIEESKTKTRRQRRRASKPGTFLQPLETITVSASDGSSDDDVKPFQVDLASV